jgi:hypothetical protein
MGPTSKWHFVLGFPSGSLEIPKVGIPATLGAHNFVCRPPIEIKFETKLYPLSRAFKWYVAQHLHATKSGLFLTFCHLTLDLSFNHNLCVKCPNGSCMHILDIYVPRAFQWYNGRFNPMGFDPYNCSLKIWESIGIPTPKVGVQLRVWGFIPSHFPTLLRAWDVTPKLPSWPAPLQTFALVASLRLGLQPLNF